MKNGRSFSAAEDDMADVYPLQLRLSVLRETNSLGVKISKKVKISAYLFLLLLFFGDIDHYDGYDYIWFYRGTFYMSYAWIVNLLFL